MLNVSQNGCSTPEKKSRSRPPSYAGGTDSGVTESPVTLRHSSRSSTLDSLPGLSPGFCSSKEQMPPPPPPQIKKPVIGMYVC